MCLQNQLTTLKYNTMINQRFGRRRRALFPWWMVAFIWIFMILGGASVLFRILKLVGVTYWVGTNESSIYGMSTYESFSLLGIFIGLLLIFKGVTAFGMWTEKDWALKLGMIDASIGIVICVVMTCLYPIFEKVDGKNSINLRFELLLLIPYLIKCIQLQKIWPEELNTPVAYTPTPEPIVTRTLEPEPIVEETPSTETEENTTVDDGMDKEDPRRFMPK